jgi:hypothetical protein
MTEFYTTQLGAGLGHIDETKRLLDLWSPGNTATQLYNRALALGAFPGTTARRLRNIVVECFAPRYLSNGGAPAIHLQIMVGRLSSNDLNQLFLLFTCRANSILADFVRGVYWHKYAAGFRSITNQDATAFVQRSVDRGKTRKVWEESTIRRVSAYLTGCCADYGLLENGQKRERRIIPLSITTTTVAYLAYELHFRGLGDNAVINHFDWSLFGLTRDETIDEIKRLAGKNLLILQSAGEAVKISWKFESMEQLCNVLADSQF